MTRKTIGRYEIRSELGRGGMGAVYLAYDSTLEREVALKLLPSTFAQDPHFSARFAREAKTIAGLDHQAIVAVYDYGEDDVWPYFVMRYMRGGSLKDHLEEGAISLGEANRIIQRVAGALDKAHGKGIVHRDVKPANILYDAEGQPYLGDFGIVRLAASSESFTRTGNAPGTPAYMSPEQADALPDIDGRSDVYSLGVVLYEMLAGEPPYQHDSMPRLLMMHLTAPIPNLLEARPDLPPAIQDVINKAMAKEPADRYQTAGEMAAALLSITGQPAPPAPQPAELAPSPATPSTAMPSAAPPPVGPTPEPAAGAADVGAETAGPAASRRRILALLGVVVGLIAIVAVAAILVSSDAFSPSDDQGQQTGADAGVSSSAIDVIRDHGHVHVGIRDSDSFPFAFEAGGEPNGFEIDLARDLVQRVFGDSVPIEFQPISVGSGLSALKSGDIDMLLRSVSKTSSRVNDPELLFSNNYFLDGLRLMVHRQSGIADWGQLDGGTVCVLAGTTHEQTISELTMAININLQLQRFANSDQLLGAFQEGQCDGYAAEWSLLEHDRATSGNGDQFEIVGGLLSHEPAGIVFGDDFEFASLVDLMLLEMIADGAWQEIYGRWFSEAPPWNLDEMLSEPPVNR